MRAILLAVSAAIFLLPVSANASRRDHASGQVQQFCGDKYGACVGMLFTDLREPRHKRVRGERRQTPERSHGGGLVTISTAVGSITVAPSFAPKIQGFISDVVARGFRGAVHCYARGGHVRGSLHYRGEACDFAQRGWGKTVAPMYHVADLAARHGLRDGCTFRDCGHIDSGGQLARSYRHSRTRYARVQVRPSYATALPMQP